MDSSGPGNNEGPASQPLVGTKALTAEFSKRDLMLYAMAIGCCSDSSSGDVEDDHGRELQYAYEHHPSFGAFPTFLLSLSFMAERTGALGSGIRPFPPESMSNYLGDGSKIGILPKEFWKDQEDSREVFPILHMSQSLDLHDEIQYATDDTKIDPPTQVQIRVRILSVNPRSVGTFVTSETTYHQEGGRLIATGRMVSNICLCFEALIHAAPLILFHCTKRLL